MSRADGVIRGPAIVAGLLAFHLVGAPWAHPDVLPERDPAEPVARSVVGPRTVARSWVIEDFRAEIHVKRSGVIDVAETLRVRFEGSYNGIFRTIPIQYVTPRGLTARRPAGPAESVPSCPGPSSGWRGRRC